MINYNTTFFKFHYLFCFIKINVYKWLIKNDKFNLIIKSWMRLLYKSLCFNQESIAKVFFKKRWAFICSPVCLLHPISSTLTYNKSLLSTVSHCHKSISENYLNFKSFRHRCSCNYKRNTFLTKLTILNQTIIFTMVLIWWQR